MILFSFSKKYTFFFQCENGVAVNERWLAGFSVNGEVWGGVADDGGFFAR